MKSSCRITKQNIHISRFRCTDRIEDHAGAEKKGAQQDVEAVLPADGGAVPDADEGRAAAHAAGLSATFAETFAADADKAAAAGDHCGL